jgi:hypothetical protein
MLRLLLLWYAAATYRIHHGCWLIHDILVLIIVIIPKIFCAISY